MSDPSVLRKLEELWYENLKPSQEVYNLREAVKKAQTATHSLYDEYLYKKLKKSDVCRQILDGDEEELNRICNLPLVESNKYRFKLMSFLHDYYGRVSESYEKFVDKKVEVDSESLPKIDDSYFPKRHTYSTVQHDIEKQKKGIISFASSLKYQIEESNHHISATHEELTKVQNEAEALKKKLGRRDYTKWVLPSNISLKAAKPMVDMPNVIYVKVSEDEALKNVFPGAIRASFSPLVSDVSIKVSDSVIHIAFKPSVIENHFFSLYVNERAIVTNFSFRTIPLANPELEYVRDIGGVNNPRGLFFLDDDTLIVSDKSEQNCIKIFTTDGAIISQFGTKGTGDGQFMDPLGFAVYKNHIYIADTKNNRVQVFTRSGTYVTQFGKEGTGPGEMKKPRGVAINEEEKLIFVSEGEESNSRIQVFDLENHQHLRMFGHYGKEREGEFNWPATVLVDDVSNNLFIIDENNVRLCIYKQSGECLNLFVQEGEKGANFGGLFGLAIDKYSRIYMCHQLRKKLLVQTPSNKQLKCTMKDLSMSLSVSISSTGLVAVSDLSKRDGVYIFQIKDY